MLYNDVLRLVAAKPHCAGVDLGSAESDDDDGRPIRAIDNNPFAPDSKIKHVDREPYWPLRLGAVFLVPLTLVCLHPIGVGHVPRSYLWVPLFHRSRGQPFDLATGTFSLDVSVVPVAIDAESLGFVGAVAAAAVTTTIKLSGAGPTSLRHRAHLAPWAPS